MQYNEPKRNFERTGFVNPRKSYYVQLENVKNEDNQDMKKMVDDGRYFTIFAPRQSGKTTFFNHFCKNLEKDFIYIAIQLSFQRFGNLSTIDFYKKIQKELYRQLVSRLKLIKCVYLEPVQDFINVHEVKDHNDFNDLFEELNGIIKSKKIVIFIDEFDGMPKHEIVPFLMTLRDLYQNYKESNEKALYSVGLVGIRNVARLTVDSKNPSPFNIADHIKLPAFTLKNIKDLYAQYTQETNQPFTNKAIQKIYEETQGQTWLVNRLGNIITKKIKPETIEPVTVEDVNKAVQELINEKSDHFDNLNEKLDLYKNVFFDIAMNDVKYSPISKEQSWLEQYGLIKSYNTKAVVLNPIYKKYFCSPENIQNYIEEPSRSKPLIFLCYAREDIKHAKYIYERLQNADLNPWLDVVDILPGQDWDYEIQKAMKRADFALVFISSVSVEKQGYINKEIKWALDRQEEKLEGDVFVIPVKIESCDLPENLLKYQSVDLNEIEGFEQILKSLIHQFGKGAENNKLASTETKKILKNDNQKDKIVFCICSECINSNKAYFYKYSILKKFQSKGKKTITCEKSVEEVSIESLLKI